MDVTYVNVTQKIKSSCLLVSYCIISSIFQTWKLYTTLRTALHILAVGHIKNKIYLGTIQLKTKPLKKVHNTKKNILNNQQQKFLFFINQEFCCFNYQKAS